MAQWLERHLPDACRILVSPAERTQQTARALQRSYETVEAIAPGASATAVLSAADWPHSQQAVLVVGHQPTLGEVAAVLLCDETRAWAIRKGAVVWLSSRPGSGERSVVLRAALAPDFV